MPQRDHYEVLGVQRHATPEEIKSAFKKLAAQYHPDRHPNDPSAHERFKEINLAYQVLSDDGRRSMYDRFGHRAEEPGSPFGSGGPFAGGTVDISDIAFDGILGDLLGVFGVGRGDKGDIKRQVELSFEEAAFGCDKSVEYERVVACDGCKGSGAASGTAADPCPNCHGRGRVRLQQGLLPLAVERTCPRCRGSGRTVRHACPKCRGSGLSTARETCRLTIPAGIESGSSRVVGGAGNRPRPDRASGDLEVVVTVRPHSFFRREGDDVLCTVPIPFTKAALGGDVEVSTLEGKGKLRVPAGTQPGTVLRIKGKGIARRAGIGRGDQRVEIAIEVPTHLTDDQRHLLERLANLSGDHVRPEPRSFVDRFLELFD